MPWLSCRARAADGVWVSKWMPMPHMQWMRTWLFRPARATCSLVTARKTFIEARQLDQVATTTCGSSWVGGSLRSKTAHRRVRYAAPRVGSPGALLFCTRGFVQYPMPTIVLQDDRHLHARLPKSPG